MINLSEVRKLAWQLSLKHSRINLFLFSFYCDHYGLFPSSEIRFFLRQITADRVLGACVERTIGEQSPQHY